MPRSEKFLSGILALGVAMVAVPSVHGDPPAAAPAPLGAGAAVMSWQIYSLKELGADPSQTEWLAQTIPQVVMPGSWSNNGDKLLGRLSWNPRGNVLVVYHTAGVQAEVKAFLDKLKQALPANATASTPTVCCPAPCCVAPAFPCGDSCVAQTVSAGKMVRTSPADGYPVPAVTQPKHLFHFIVRYEGEGIIDSNVVRFAKIVWASELAEAKALKASKDAAEAGEKIGPPKKMPPSLAFTSPMAEVLPEVKWRTDYDAARTEAQEKKRPLLIEFAKSDCPACKKMDDVFRDAKIRDLILEKFVALRIDGEKHRDLAKQLNVNACPSFVFASPDGKLMEREPIEGCREASCFLAILQRIADPPSLPALSAGKPE